MCITIQSLLPKNFFIEGEGSHCRDVKITYDQAVIQIPQQIDGLKLIILNVAKQCFGHFMNQDYKEFDALVGENACQLRAAKIQELGMSRQRISCSFESQITKMDELRACIIENQERGSQEKELKLTKDEEFLVLSHLLKVVRDYDSRLATDLSHSSLLKAFAESKSTLIHEKNLDGLMFHCKKELANRSITHIREQAKMLNSDLLRKFLVQEEVASSFGIKAVGCFFNFQTILFKMIKSQYPLILNIGNEELFCFIADIHGRLVRVDFNENIESLPAFVIFLHPVNREGLPSIKEKLKHPDLLNFLLADAADHPLFAGESKGKGMNIFLHEDIKIYLDMFNKQSNNEIEKQVDTYFTNKKREQRKVDTACQPAAFVDVFKTYQLFNRLKVIGKEQKRIIEIQHIYCNQVGKEFQELSLAKAKVLKNSENA